MTIGAFVGLCEVSLGHVLLQADHSRPRAPYLTEHDDAPIA